MTDHSIIQPFITSVLHVNTVVSSNNRRTCMRGFVTPIWLQDYIITGRKFNIPHFLKNNSPYQKSIPKVPNLSWKFFAGYRT